MPPYLRYVLAFKIQGPAECATSTGETGNGRQAEMTLNQCSNFHFRHTRPGIYVRYAFQPKVGASISTHCQVQELSGLQHQDMPPQVERRLSHTPCIITPHMSISFQTIPRSICIKPSPTHSLTHNHLFTSSTDSSSSRDSSYYPSSAASFPSLSKC